MSVSEFDLSFTPEILAQLKQADRLPYNPRPREFIKNAPRRVLLIIADGITPQALERANTPTFDALAARGVRAVDARTIFPTITGPAHTALLTGARVGVHEFLYPKLLDAYGNRLLDFVEGLMRAETVAEAWRPNGIVSVGIGSRFLRGADAQISEGIVGQDFVDIAERAVQAVREWEPHFLLVVFYVADTMGHLFGPAAPQTLAAIEQIDAMTGRILEAYAEKNFLDETVVTVLADHGMMQCEIADSEFVERVGALPSGRVALAPRKFAPEDYGRLLNDPRIEDIWGEEELRLLGAWHARWGEQVVLLREGLMFPYRTPLVGYHGAWSMTEKRIPLILSGSGIRTGAALGTCEIIDLAPTLSLLLGGAIPSHSQGRILWEALDVEDAPDASVYVQLLLDRERLLSDLQVLKKDYAAGMIRQDRFEMRRMEMKRLAEKILEKMERERGELGCVGE